jgi:hypothetical protein
MEVHKNTFDGGLDTNISKNLIKSNKYVDGQNVNLVASSNFFSLENIKGTTSVADIIPSANSSVLGVFSSNYKIGTTLNVPCLTIITAIDNGPTSTLNVFAFDTQNEVLYELYEEVFDGTDYFTSDRVVDGILYPENGIDILYFTDFFNSLRKIRCYIPTPYSANFLTELDVRVIQHGALGTIQCTSNTTGGSLFCGSYQIAYQLVNPETNQFTRYSLFTNPIHIFLNRASGKYGSKSGIGVQSSGRISVNITPSEDELSYYTHFRLAIIENIEPSGVAVTKAQLTQLTAISDYLVSGTIQNYLYESNVRLESIDISEILVDRLAIEAVKTMCVRDNRLVVGNIVYKQLDYDNGIPAIGSGSILRQSASVGQNLFNDPDDASKYRGHFREEVYRYAISYFDDDGNFSYPSVLDMSTITHNQISGDYADMKFPARSQNLGGTTYTLFNEATGGIQSLGLRFEDIDNHPTWAKGFVILRAKRLKNILFQTPIIPMNKVFGIGALEDYPSASYIIAGGGILDNRVDHPDSQPMGPFTTYVPRNYFFEVATDIDQYTVASRTSGSGVNKKISGEAYLLRNDFFSLGMIFPPEFMYNDTPYVFSPSHSFKQVDAALVRGRYNDFSDINIGTNTAGRNIKTSISATFYALSDPYYYYNSTHNGAKSVLNSAIALSGAESFNNYGEGALLSGSNIYRYDKLTTPGIAWGEKANVQKSTVIKLDIAKAEFNRFSDRVFAAGSQITKPDNASQAFYTTNGTRVHTIEIGNVLTGLDDNRYGPYETPHEFISTGAMVTFSDAELQDVELGNSVPKTVDVWGGDCYTVPHLFKLTDTVYGVTNSAKFESSAPSAETLISSFERLWTDLPGDTALSLPIPFKNASQYIQIVLESEYNAGVLDTEIINEISNVGSIPLYGIDNEDSCRVPLTYKLNTNHKKENADKVFSIKDPLLNSNTLFNSRFAYSDQKVYQTSVVGFDTFRVLNFKDLEETYGDIHKLAVVGDDLYTLQERAVSYIGIGERTLETTDALTLAVQSGSFIGNIILVDNNKGTQHLQSIKNTGNALYFVDNINQTVNRLSGKQIDVISETTMASAFREKLISKIDENKVVTIHDPILKQLWFVNNDTTNTFCYVFDEARGLWISNYQFPASTLFNGIYTNQQLYLIGKNADTNNTEIATAYSGDRTYLFGTSVTPSVTVVCNPAMEIGKVFNDVLVMSSERLNTLDVLVEREGFLGDQTCSGISLDVTTRGEGNYRAKILRDSVGARLRGPLASLTLNWMNGVESLPQAKVSSIITKYQISENKF